MKLIALRPFFLIVPAILLILSAISGSCSDRRFTAWRWQSHPASEDVPPQFKTHGKDRHHQCQDHQGDSKFSCCHAVNFQSPLHARTLPDAERTCKRCFLLTASPSGPIGLISAPQPPLKPPLTFLRLPPWTPSCQNPCPIRPVPATSCLPNPSPYLPNPAGSPALSNGTAGFRFSFPPLSPHALRNSPPPAFLTGTLKPPPGPGKGQRRHTRPLKFPQGEFQA